MRRLLAVCLDILFAIAGLLYLPVVIYRLIFAGRYRHGWASRFGFVPNRPSDRPCIWLHAVSVGEVNATRTLVESLRQQMPFHEIMISTTTDTGYTRAVTLFGPDSVFIFPFDFSLGMHRAFDRLKPAMIILIELVVWPNLVMEANRRSVPVVVANGRITERSLRRYMIAGPLTKWLFAQIDLVLAQDDVYCERFLKLGVRESCVIQTGSLKWDTAHIDEQSTETQDTVNALAEAMGIERNKPMLVAGCTGDTIEEEAVIRAYQQLRVHHPDLQLAIAPRKPERFDLVARLIKSRGFKTVRRSEHPNGTTIKRSDSLIATPVFLLDTIGELRYLYAMASVVVVGRTFIPGGGSDVMEIAALGKAMIVGPSVDNFADAVGKLLDNDAAVQLDTTEKLASSIAAFLSDPVKLSDVATRARDVVKAEQGATSRTVQQACNLLGYEFDTTGRGIATPKLKKPQA